jgi:hypothetical protein
VTGPEWTSPCGTNACIEVRARPGHGLGPGVEIRSGSSQVVLFATDAEWWQFLDGVKAGALDDVIPRRQQ